MVKLWVARMQEMAHRAHIFKKIPRTPAYNKADHAFGAPGEGGGALPWWQILRAKMRPSLTPTNFLF